MTTNEHNESIASPYLTNLIRKLDARKPDTRGYVTKVPELQGILKEITPLVSVGVYTHENYNRDDTDTVPVEIKLSMHLSRSEMQKLQETFEAMQRGEKPEGSTED